MAPMYLRAFPVLLLLLLHPAAATLRSVTSKPTTTSAASRSTAAADKCELCKVVGHFLGPLLRANLSRTVISEVAVAGCKLLHVRCVDAATCGVLCPDIVDEYASIAVDVFSEPQAACVALKMCAASPLPAPVPVPVPASAVPMAANLSDMAGAHAWPSWNQTLTGEGYYLQVTDIHLDTAYLPGAKVDCGLPLCCREGSGSAGANTSNAAGFWGTSRAGPASGCDSAPWMVDDMMAKLAGEINQKGKRPLDFILYTGDSPPHNIWDQSRDQNMQSIHAVTA